MPARVMFWNIQDLGINKLTPSASDPTAMRRLHIMHTLTRVNPDVLVVLEVQTAGAGKRQGELISDTSGGPAVLEILRLLRVLNANGYFGGPVNWRAVPPVIVGSSGEGFKEGVAVFFKGSKFDFAGPNQVDDVYKFVRNVPTISGQESASVGGHASAGYRAPWNNCLPAAPPVGPPIGGGLNQDQLAAKWAYADADRQGYLLGFPEPQHRAPILVHLREHNGTGAVQRLLSIFGVHTSPPKAREAVQKIAKIQEVSAPLAVNEVRLIGGDFNINRLTVSGSVGYDPLIYKQVPRTGGANTRYEWAQRPAPPMAPPIPPSPTLIKSVEAAYPMGDAPYYDYVSTGWLVRERKYNPAGSLKCVDGVLVASGTGILNAPTGFTVNTVVGSPPPPSAPVIPQAMLNSIPQILASFLGYPKKIRRYYEWTHFRNISNYGKIRGASDHFAVFADV